MRIQTGRVATAEATVDIEYRCSSCGEDNLFTETVSGSAQTGTILGIDLDQKLEQHAQEALLKNLFSVAEQNNTKRFRNAGFSCKCRKCGHTEPWAKMQFAAITNLTAIVYCIMILLGVVSFLLLCSLAVAKEFIPTVLIPLAALALSIAAYFGLKAWRNKKCEEQEQQIAALPKESIPTVRLHSKDRHDAFYTAPVVPTPAKATYEKWECPDCGTQNSMQYAQCKKCGKYKTS